MTQVAVIIAGYNAAGTIARAVKSALNEKEVAEVIVVDDASTDKTAQAARDADDGSGRLSVLVQARNAGPSAARNRALRESRAPWVCVLDSDDFFLPGRIKGLLNFTDGADFVADDMWQVDEHDVDGPRRGLLKSALTAGVDIGFDEFVLSNVTRAGRDRGELGFIKPLMRRAFLDAHDIHYQEHMRLGEDYELYARALAHGARLRLAPAQGYVSVVRANSLSARHSEDDLLNLRDCNLKIEKDIALSPREKSALKKHYSSIDCRLQWRLLINAVKARDARAALGTFMRPWPVPLYLVQKLAEQVWVRAFRQKTP